MTSRASVLGLLALIYVIGVDYSLTQTVSHFTGGRQFPINSLSRFPLSWVALLVEVMFSLWLGYLLYVAIRGSSRPPAASRVPADPVTPVAILITTCNEPLSVLRRTVVAAKAATWSGRLRIYLLDDSLHPDRRQEVAALASTVGARHLCREGRRGFKAGNVNHAVRSAVEEPFFVLLDADQALVPGFIEETMAFAGDSDIAFVQTPQKYAPPSTLLERSAYEAQSIYYRIVCAGRDRDGAAPFCGTNVLVRTSAFREVGGFALYSATEDADFGLRLRAAGYRGLYLSTPLALGLAPPDVKALKTQQYRWANGNMAVFRESLRHLLHAELPIRFVVHTVFGLTSWLLAPALLLSMFVTALVMAGLPTHQTWLSDGATVLGTLLPWTVLAMVIGVLLPRDVHRGNPAVSALLVYALLCCTATTVARACFNALVLGTYSSFEETRKYRVPCSVRDIGTTVGLGLSSLLLAVLGYWRFFHAASYEAQRAVGWAATWLLLNGIAFSSSLLLIDWKTKPALRSASLVD